MSESGHLAAGSGSMRPWGNSEQLSAVGRRSWQGVVRERIIDLDLHFDSRSRLDFSGELTIRRCGNLQVSRTATHIAHCARRDERHIQSSFEDCYWICFVLSGRVRLIQGSSIADLRPGDFALLDSTRRYELQLSDSTDELWIRTPRTVLQGRLIAPQKLLATRIDGDAGVGWVASQLLSAVSNPRVVLQDEAGKAIADSLLSLVTAACVGVLDHGIVVPSEYRLAKLGRIQRFIEGRITDPEIAPAEIARRHGISVRYLNKLFQSEGSSVARWIWSRRLEISRAALEDPLKAHRSVTDIACSCGFKNNSHFTKAFKKRFGVAPSAYRRAHRRERV